MHSKSKVLQEVANKQKIRIGYSIPSQARLFCMVVSCPQVALAHKQLGSIQGISHSEFDKVWMNNNDDGYSTLHTYCMWNYDYEQISEIVQIDSMNFFG
mmetsp:Transcript_12241/g.15865  ORF Transcript_12241/g.15865 Transcript_12241/m.15865 type:complete len:99 (-) Transcript_12241:196-492(-)